MLGGILILTIMGTFSTFAYGIGKLHGYDKWDRENEGFQKGLKKNG